MSAKVIEKEKLYEKFRETTVTIDPDEAKRINRPFTPVGKAVSVLLIISYLFAIWFFTVRGVGGMWWQLGGVMLIYLLIRQFFALLYTPCKSELTKEYKVSAIITCFNENPSSVVSIFENILASEHPVHEVVFLDDGSADTIAFEVAKSFAEEHQGYPGAPKFKIIRFDENRGKRALMMDGFQIATGDYILLIDSDSVFLPNALTELLRPFEDGKTTSVVGYIGVLNKADNFLTRLQSLTYFGCFQTGRAMQSVTGDIVVCSGAFCIHQKGFILDNLEALRYDKIFGITVSAGDDRAITTLSKMSGGKTRYQSTAYSETVVPNKMKKFMAQRRRWQRSIYLCSLKSIKEVFPQNLWYCFWAFTGAHLLNIVVIVSVTLMLVTGERPDPWHAVIYFMILTYGQTVFYALYKPLRFLTVPIYLTVYFFIYIAIRLYTLFTLADDNWGTRGPGASAKELAETSPDNAESKPLSVSNANSGPITHFSLQRCLILSLALLRSTLQPLLTKIRGPTLA